MTEEPVETAATPRRREGRRRLASVTIRDVARASNVSVGTASKALNNSGRLRHETREKVIAAASALGFRPNDLAQSLHRGQSLAVGLISTDAFGRFTIPIMEGIEECLSESRMAVLMCNATDDPAREARHVEQLMGKRVDGVIVTARRVDQRPKLAISGDIPVIYVFSKVDDADACCLVPDDEGGAALATRHLVDLGRTRIAHVTGPERFEAVRLRRDGYLRALAIVTVALFAFINSWNEFLAALIFMNRETSFTVPILLVSVQIGHHGAVDWGALQASIMIAILPCLAVYLALQRYYISGLLSGGVK